MAKQRLILSSGIIAAAGLLSACTQQNGANPSASLTDATSAAAMSAKMGTMTTPLSYGYLLDKKIPVPSFKELAFNGKAANPAALATKDAIITASTPVTLQQATPEVEQLISKYSLAYNVPERLVRRVVKRESNGNPGARNGPYFGLMQITHPTAKGMGYAGDPKGLLDAETNLRFAVKYLAGAYKVAEGDESQAVRLYARGYYYDAKAKGLLEETGLRDGPNAPDTAFEAIENVAPQQASASTGNGTVIMPASGLKNNGT